MSKWDKLLERIYALSKAFRFDELRKQPITIPKHEPIKKVYVELVKQIVEGEAKQDEDVE